MACEPSRKELRMLAHQQVGRRWKPVGRELELTEVDLDTIEYNERGQGVVEQAYAMLVRWKQTRGESARLAEVQAALNKVITNGSGNFPPAPFPGVAVSYLHQSRGSFVGRSDLLSWMKRYFLLDGNKRGFQMLLLHGLGGVGKTELILEFMCQNHLQYPDGVFLLNAESTASLMTSVSGYLCELRARNIPGDSHETWNLFRSFLGELQKSLLVFDSADDLSVLKGKYNHFLPTTLANLTVHVVICSRDEGTFLECEKKEVKLLPLSDSLELFTRRFQLSLDALDLQAASELVGEKIINGLPLGLVHAAFHIKSRGITIQDYVRRVKEKEESIKMMRKECSLSDFLRYFHLSDIAGRLKTKLGVEKVADLNRVSDADVESLDLHGRILERLKLVLKTVCDQLPNFPVWEMDIEIVKEESHSSYEMLKCCALLASSAIPEYLLQKFWEMQGNFDKTFEGDIKCMTNFALLSPVTHTGDVRSYQMHRLVQESIRGFRICGQNEIQCLVDKISHCLLYHFPSRDAIVQGIDLADRNLSVWIAHLNAISLLVQELHITKGNPEDLFELTRTVAITIKDLPWAMKLNVASVQRAVSTRMSNKEIASRLIDEATCFYNMKQYTECKETISKAREYIDELVFEDSRWSWSFTVRRDVLAWAASCQELMMKPPALTAEMSQLCQLQIGFTNSILTIATFYSDQFVEIAEALQEDLKKILLLCVEAFGTDFPQAAVNAYIQIRLSDWSFQRAVEAFQPVLSEAGVRLNFGVICQKAKGAYGSYWSNFLKCFPSPENSLIMVTYLRSFGEFLQVMDECERAEIVYKKALNVGLEIFHKDHIIIGEIQEQLGDCYKSLGRDAQAATCYSEALEIAAKSTTIDSSNAQIQRKYAKALVSSDPDKARGLFEEAVSISTGMDEFAANIDLAEFYCSQEMYSKALSILHEANDKHAYSCIDINECVQLLPMAFTDIQQSLVRSRCFLGLGWGELLIEEVSLFIAPSSFHSILQSIFPSVRETMGDFHMCLAQWYCQEHNHVNCVQHCKDAIEDFTNCFLKTGHKVLAAVALWTRSCLNIVGCDKQYQILDSIDALDGIRAPADISDIHISALQEVTGFFSQSEDIHDLKEELQTAVSNACALQESKKQAHCLQAKLAFLREPSERMNVSSDSSSYYRKGERVPATVSLADSKRRAYTEPGQDHPSDPTSESYKISPMDPETCSSILSSIQNLSSGQSTVSLLGTPDIVISRSAAGQEPCSLPSIVSCQTGDTDVNNVSDHAIDCESVSVTEGVSAIASVKLDTSPNDGPGEAVATMQIWQKGTGGILDDMPMTPEVTPHGTGEPIVRQKELNHLYSVFHMSLESKKFQVVVLHGACGIGKTFLAKKFVENFSYMYPDGIVWASADSALSVYQSSCIAIRKQGFEVCNDFVEDLQSFQRIVSQQQSMMIIYDNADLRLVEECIRPIVGTVHILVITRSQTFYDFWTEVPKIQLEPLTVNQAVQLVIKNISVSRRPSSRKDARALKELIEQDMADGSPFELVCFAKKFCTESEMVIADFVALLKEYNEKVGQRTSTVDGWLKFYHMSGLKTHLTSKYDVQSLSDIRSLSHNQIKSLGLFFFDQRRLENGIAQLKSDKPRRLSLWELDIRDMSAKYDDCHKLLQYCALLSSTSPIPEYLLRECLKAHVIPLPDDQFHKAIAQLTNSGLLSLECNISPTGNKCYTLPSPIRKLIRHYYLPDSDVRNRLSILNQVVGRHLSQLKDVHDLLLFMDSSLNEICPHVQALAKTLDKATVLGPSCKKIFHFMRALSITVKDPNPAKPSCHWTMKGFSARLQSERLATHLVDLALCYAERKQWDTCQHTLDEATRAVGQIEDPQMSLATRMASLQYVVSLNRSWFYMQFFGQEGYRVFLSLLGSCNRLISLLTHYDLLSNISRIQDIFATVLYELEAKPHGEMTLQMRKTYEQVGVKNMEQIFHKVCQAVNTHYSWPHIERFFSLSSGLLRRMWKLLLSYDAATDISLQTLGYWQSRAEYLCSTDQSLEAYHLYRQLLDKLQGCLPFGHSLIGETWKQMGDCCLRVDNLAEAFDCYAQAANILSLSNQDPLQFAMLITNLAKSCTMSKPNIAEEKLVQALRLYEKTGDQLMVLAATKDLATFFYDQKCYDRTVEICQTVEIQATEWFEQVDMQVPGKAICYAVNIVKMSSLFIHCLKEKGDYQTAIDKSELLFRDENQETAIAKTFAAGRAILGEAYICTGDCLLHEYEHRARKPLLMAALLRYHEGLELYVNSVGKENPKIIAGLVSLAHCYLVSREIGLDNLDHILKSRDALMRVTNQKELAQCHAEDVDNLAILFVAVNDQEAAQLAQEVSKAVSKHVSHKTTFPAAADIDEDSLPIWDVLNLAQQESQAGSLRGLDSTKSQELSSTSGISSSQVSEQSPATIYFIETPTMKTIRDLLAWSCTPKLLVPPKQDTQARQEPRSQDHV